MPQPTDEYLIREFLLDRSESAFRLLVDRHGPLVLSVCRRNTFTADDADDAFQATFLILTQSVRKVRRQKSLPAWLYGVALRVCARLRRDLARKSLSPLQREPAVACDPLDELLARHDGVVIDEELAALPETLRSPLVLRYLSGLSNAQAAEELGISIATLEGRLKRSKHRLRLRLLRRGVTLAAVVAVLKATRVSAASVPEALATRAIESCCVASGGRLDLSADGDHIPHRISLEELNAMNTLSVPKMVLAATVAGGLAALTIGSQLAMSQSPGDGGGILIDNTPVAVNPVKDLSNSIIIEAAEQQVSAELRDQPAGLADTDSNRNDSLDADTVESSESIAVTDRRSHEKRYGQELCMGC